MINLVFENGKAIKEKEGAYLIGLPSGEIYEADSFRELAAVICGFEFLDCESAETELHMRVAAAKRIGLATMAAEELNAGLSKVKDEDQIELNETIIIYDERIGKIPYSYTDANVDYDIHGNPELIRVECDKTFIYTLEKDRLVAVFVRNAAGEYQRISAVLDLDEEIKKELIPFKEAAEKQGRVLLHKKLGE